MLLGGGLGSAEEVLSAFETGFSSGCNRFRTQRLVLDEDEYVRWSAVVGAEPHNFGGYFSAYRYSFQSRCQSHIGRSARLDPDQPVVRFAVTSNSMPVVRVVAGPRGRTL
jgi:hypothetical protein